MTAPDLMTIAVGLLEDQLGATVIAEYPSNAAVIALPRCLTDELAKEISIPPGMLPILLDGWRMRTWGARAPGRLAKRIAGRDAYTVNLPAAFQDALAAAVAAAENTGRAAGGAGCL